MCDRRRLDAITTVQVGGHVLGASLGAIDAEEAEVRGANGLDSWVNDTTRLLQNVTTRLAALL
jgi:ribonucleotide reductase alpha subunit